MTSISVLAGVMFFLPGMMRTPLGTLVTADRPVSYVTGEQAGARPQATRPIASPARPVGYDAHVADPTDTNPARYVGLIESGGADSLRDDVTWAFIEPTEGHFDWSAPDEIVTLAAEHHLHPLLIVDTSPRWASGGSTANGDWAWLPPRSAAAYGVFAAQVAARYGPGGVFWREHPNLPAYLPAGLELWNEENLARSWGERTPSPAVYAAMVAAAYPRIKRADAAMTVVLGGLAPQGGYDDLNCTGRKGTGHDAGGWNGLNYLQALYADGIHGHFDAVGWHAYNYWTGATAAQMLAYDSCSAWSQMAATPVSVRSLMTAHADAAKRIWITEAGAPTCIGSAASSPYRCVLPAQQADLASSETRIWRTLSWAGGFYWYEIRDDSAETKDSSGHFGTVTADDSPKPAYHALEQAWAAAPPKKSPLTLPVPGSRAVRSVAFSADGKFLAAGDAAGHVDIWQVSTRRLASSLTDPRSKGASSVAFNPAGSLLAAGDANGHVYLWAAGQVHAALAVPSGKAVRSVAFSSDGKFLAAGDAAGHVYVWQVSTLRLASSMTDPGSKGVTSVAFNPANSLLAAGDANGHTYLWASGLAGTLADPSGKGVTSVAFSGNNAYLAVGDANGRAYIWLVSKREVVQPLTSPDGKAVDSVAFAPSATLLATADADGHIYLWTNAPKIAASLTDPRSGGIASLTFSPNGQYLAAADANGHVYLWPSAS
jgi:polysaccharide biosynthesis protein PslG